MSADFTIDVEPERNLVRTTMSGLFLPADIDRYLEARMRALHELRCGPDRHRALIDVREMKIQPQESVEIFRRVLAGTRHPARRLAFVTAPTLARAQLLRALAGREAPCFDTIAAAERWLLAGDDAAGRVATRAG